MPLLLVLLLLLLVLQIPGKLVLQLWLCVERRHSGSIRAGRGLRLHSIRPCGLACSQEV